MAIIRNKYQNRILGKLPLILLLAIYFLSTTYSFSQLNLKVGYTLDYSQYSINNRIFQDYNESNPWLTSSFNRVHFSHGVQFGVRLKKDFIALDLNWERVRNDKKAIGISDGGIQLSKELNYTLNRFSAGVEAYNKFFGLGANINYSQFSIKSPSASNIGDKDIVKSTDFGNKVYLILSTPGLNTVSFSIQPFIQIPWTGPNLFDLNNFLGNAPRLKSYNQNNLHFGLSLIFYNGPQN